VGIGFLRLRRRAREAGDDWRNPSAAVPVIREFLGGKELLAGYDTDLDAFRASEADGTVEDTSGERPAAPL
jgi:hypothetical protein